VGRRGPAAEEGSQATAPWGHARGAPGAEEADPPATEERGGKEERGGGAGGRPAMAAEAAAGEGVRGEAKLIPCRREYSVYSSKP